MEKQKYESFSLTLMVNHACNLRCNYCYTGSKFSRAMVTATGDRAVRLAIDSTRAGGRLDLGFFGGEPLLEASRIRGWIQYAQIAASAKDIGVVPNLTTNGTIASPEARELMYDPELQLAISCDGSADTHDWHRQLPNGTGSFDLVRRTLDELVSAGRDFQVVMVIRPDTVAGLADNLRFLHAIGVRRFELSLDLWSKWTREDAALLATAIGEAGEFWRSTLPDLSINWFDTKLVSLVGVPEVGDSVICGYGDGEVAVAPSGNLYPCERLIGEDASDNAARLSGHVMSGEDFLFSPAGERAADACQDCAIRDMCSTTCRCSNFVRTGDVTRPDGLLCLLDKCAHQEALKLVMQSSTPNRKTKKENHHERTRRDTGSVRRASCS
jgi:uncharacterized protein